MNGHATFWLLLGLVLMASELLLPGLVVGFLGLGALLVAGAVKLGLIDHWMAAGTAWFMTSLGLILTLRGAVMRLFPPEVTQGRVEEDDSDAYGEIVDVVEAVTSEDDSGRIRYRGATWTARSVDEALPPGSKAQLVYRDNLVWIVESAQGKLNA